MIQSNNEVMDQLLTDYFAAYDSYLSLENGCVYQPGYSSQSPQTIKQTFKQSNSGDGIWDSCRVAAVLDVLSTERKMVGKLGQFKQPVDTVAISIMLKISQTPDPSPKQKGWLFYNYQGGYEQFVRDLTYTSLGDHLIELNKLTL